MEKRKYVCWSEDAGDDEANAHEFVARGPSDAALDCFKRDSADEFFERGEVHVRDVGTGELSVFTISAQITVQYNVSRKRGQQ